MGPNILGGVARGIAAGNALANFNRERDVRETYRQHGAGILAGNQNALNALAAVDPMGAFNVQAQRQSLALRQRQEDRLSADFKMRVAEHKANLTAAEAKAQAAAIERGVRAASAAQTPEEWDRLAVQFGQDELVGQFANKDALLRQYMTVAEILAADEGPKPDYVQIDGQLVDRNAPGGPAVVPVDGLSPKGPEWRAATPKEAARYGATAGQFNIKTGEFKRTPADKGMRLESDGKGGFVLVQGEGAAAGDSPSVGDVYDPGEVVGTVGLIDEILNDPALPRVTGPIQGGGGNDVDDFGIGRRTYYGDDGLAVVQKINQLQSRAWLAARAMLKGGGPITDYESRKAEAAVARLSRAQGDAEFKAALKDLRDAITEGMAKLESANGGGSGQVASPAVGGQGSGDQYQFENDRQRYLFEKYSAPTGG